MEKIKSVMSGFQLPSSSIPDWARSISDDQWQFQVVNRLVKAETNPGNEVSSSIGTSQELAVSPDKGTSLKHSNSEEGEPV
ncbi:hypothetical protein DPMN_095622 [Dreissena polymorpha]|uniref:Male-enhanced antigen 1 n=2 Tax=Dreissena polymorpha TaxID=45954 RepID=A0A9D4L8A8_DREPO|nr:hypothetical protein DPMN_095622 [Dreissena polymorpha]